MGKGYAEDHSEVGRRIAIETCERLGLPKHEAEMVTLLNDSHTYYEPPAKHSALARLGGAGNGFKVAEAVDLPREDVGKIGFQNHSQHTIEYLEPKIRPVR